LITVAPLERHYFVGAGAVTRCGSGSDGSCLDDDVPDKNDVLKWHRLKEFITFSVDMFNN
jgi:hypothetical protein